MKKITSLILSLSIMPVAMSAIVNNNVKTIFQHNSISVFADDSANKLIENCKSAYLCDANSGECIYKFNETERMPIASVCKVMTLTLCFEAIEAGKLSYDTEIAISKNAAGMGGSQVFLQSGLKYKLSELVKSIIVCSANDSCVAVSEAVSGSEEAFVVSMNKRATELGCNNTLFANCTGLPKETQYSCAKDVAVMFSNLISHKDYFKYSKIWLEDFRHPDNRTISITNTNKLIRKYPACDGGKTGFTNQAGFCLASTAVQDNLRLVSSVLGGTTSDDRFKSTTNMFNYGFANFKNKTVLDKDVNLSDSCPVECGKKDSILVHPAKSAYVFSPKDDQPDITKSVIFDRVVAPISKGDRVGTIEIYKDGILFDTIELLSSEDVERATFGDFFKKVAENWN